jgi:hypothetical protein
MPFLPLPCKMLLSLILFNRREETTVHDELMEEIYTAVHTCCIQCSYHLLYFKSQRVRNSPLKVPNENFSLAFFALSEPTWVCDLGSGKKSRIFYQMIPDFEGLWFLPRTEGAVNK